MLSYHFGSRAGLLAAVVNEVEQQERDRSLAAAPTNDLDPTAMLEQFWHTVSRPARANEERLFFELAALALRDEPGTETLRANLIEPWLAVGEQMYRALPVELATPALKAAAREVTRLDVAVVRGLLLDLLATKNRRAVDASFRRYVAWRRAAFEALIAAP
jgi:AcrR family transcriptional regulator